MSKRVVSTVVVGLFSLALTSAAPAGERDELITLVSQSRYVHCQSHSELAGDEWDSEHGESAEGFGLFQNHVSCNLCGANQESRLNQANLLWGNGHSSGTWESDENYYNTCQGESRVTVTFDVNQPVSIHLLGFLDAEGDGVSEVKLREGELVYFHHEVIAGFSGASMNLHEPHTLDPGRYTLRFAADAEPYPYAYGGSDYNWEFQMWFWPADCNDNGVFDGDDIAGGTSGDCNANWYPDECEPQTDCNDNGYQDICDVALGTSPDCNENGIPDECDLAEGTSFDCQPNGIPDECEDDCNGNGVDDSCDIAAGTSFDCQENGTPDECEGDCNGNGIADECDLAEGTSLDCQGNGTPDECETDCNENSFPDDCDIAAGTSQHCQANGIPDECELGVDCNANSVPDECDLAGGTSVDDDENGIPDECAEVIYVDADAPGANDGTSWNDAFVDLQDALDASLPGDQVWVAAGTYLPDRGTGDREATFQIQDDLEVYGGFAGGETALEQRDAAANPTILSGDLTGNDEPDFVNYAENSLHVVTLTSTSIESRLDGFVIRGGLADLGYAGGRGAGTTPQVKL